MRIRRVPDGSVRVRSAVIVRRSPAGKPMSSLTFFHVPSDSCASTYGTIAAKVAGFARYCHGRGWSEATSGNYSLRLGDDRFAISASGFFKGELRPQDILLVDRDGVEVGQALDLGHGAILPRPPASAAVR